MHKISANNKLSEAQITQQLGISPEQLSRKRITFLNYRISATDDFLVITRYSPKGEFTSTAPIFRYTTELGTYELRLESNEITFYRLMTAPPNTVIKPST